MHKSISMSKRRATTVLTVALGFVLCGGPQIVSAQQPAAQQQPPAAQSPNAQTTPDTAQQPDAPQSQDTTSATTDQQTPSGTSTQQQQQSPRPGMVDPSQGPLTPVPSTTPDQQPTVQPQDLPDAPSATQTQQPDNQQTAPQRPTKPRSTQPVGVGTAQQAPTAGGAASKPAGAAIAPAKQKQYRSLLLKIGAIAAGGAALGTVYALSRGTNSKPPGAR
jgi:hypothetical protein